MKRRVRFLVILIVVLGGCVVFNFRSGLAASSSRNIQGRSLLITAIKGDNSDRDFTVSTQVSEQELVLSISAAREYNYVVELFDITGKQLVSQRIRPAAAAFVYRLSFYDFPDGIYMMKLGTDDSSTLIFRIIKTYNHAAH